MAASSGNDEDRAGRRPGKPPKYTIGPNLESALQEASATCDVILGIDRITVRHRASGQSQPVLAGDINRDGPVTRNLIRAKVQRWSTSLAAPRPQAQPQRGSRTWSPTHGIFDVSGRDIGEKSG